MSVSRAGARRVVVSVSPRVLGDALSVALRDRELEVEVRSDLALEDCPDLKMRVCGEPSPPEASATAGRFDLAVTSGDLPPDVVADVIVVLPTEAGDPTVRILRASHPEERRDLATLESVLRLVADLLGEFR
jgi:hypothetical protein